MLNVKHITYNNYKQAKEYSCKRKEKINKKIKINRQSFSEQIDKKNINFINNNN